MYALIDHILPPDPDPPPAGETWVFAGKDLNKNALHKTWSQIWTTVLPFYFHLIHPHPV